MQSEIKSDWVSEENGSSEKRSGKNFEEKYLLWISADVVLEIVSLLVKFESVNSDKPQNEYSFANKLCSVWKR